MEHTELKRKMMALWKDAFHDSDQYVELIFDNYFDPELVAYETAGPEVVAALMGIPYEFGGEQGKIRGLYICGVNTKPKFRGQGISTRLLDQINEKSKKLGYAFTFLIPATERLQRFYSRRGYVDAFYRCDQNYTSLHDFRLEFETFLEGQKGKVVDLKRGYYDTLLTSEILPDTSEEVLEKVVELVLAQEMTQGDLEIIHSAKDMRAVIRENQISGGHIYYVSTPQGQITAVAFTNLIDRTRIDIGHLYSTDQVSTYRLLDFIKRSEPDAGIRMFVQPRNSERKNLAKMHGMARILNLSEILKFQADGHGDLKYSILVNEVPGQVERYDVRNGTVRHRGVSKDSEEYDPSRTVISQKDISCVLFRRPDSGALITEAFGMPSLGGYISLMLD